jgi:serine phosphatase RsbU (regulator of sigma subunit)
LVAAQLRAAIRSLSLADCGVDVMMSGSNRVLRDAESNAYFITLLLARLDPHTRSLEYASAGHEYGLVFDRAGELRAELRGTGLPLGTLDDDTRYVADAITLVPGDLVVLITDGVREAHSSGGALFGMERCKAVVRTHRQAPAPRIAVLLGEAVRAHCRPDSPPDDVTAVVIQVSDDAAT